jgi:hypothetical protein
MISPNSLTRSSRKAPAVLKPRSGAVLAGVNGRRAQLPLSCPEVGALSRPSGCPTRQRDEASIS